MWGPVKESGNARCRAIVRGHPIGDADAESGDQRLEIIAPTDGDGNVTNGVFDDQIPTNDPGNQLAERRIGIGVRAAGNRDHRCEFRIAQCGKSACNGGEYKRQDQTWTGSGPGCIPGRCCADSGKYTGADDCSDA